MYKKKIGKVRCLCGDNMDTISVIKDEEENNKIYTILWLKDLVNI